MILKVLMIGFGIFLLIMDLFMYARQKLTDVIGLGWAIVSLALLVAGIVVSLDDVCYLWSGAKNIVLLMFAVFAVIILFWFKISMAVSVVVVKNQELAMQVSLLNQENERILQELKVLVDEKEDPEVCHKMCEGYRYDRDHRRP